MEAVVERGLSEQERMVCVGAGGRGEAIGWRGGPLVGGGGGAAAGSWDESDWVGLEWFASFRNQRSLLRRRWPIDGLEP